MFLLPCHRHEPFRLKLKQLPRRASSGTTSIMVDRKELSSDNEICNGEQQSWNLDGRVNCQGGYINAFQLVPL